MAKMKTGRTTSITTPPPSDYKKYQSDSTNYEEQSKFYKNYNFDIKSFGNQARFGTPKKAKPSIYVRDKWTDLSESRRRDDGEMNRQCLGKTQNWHKIRDIREME